MELNIQRQPIAACELLLAANAEHPIECDVLLPDACPDLVRVLSCQVTGTVTDASVRGGNFLVDGMATVTLCYLGEVGGMRKTEYRLPFSKTFELPAEAVDPVYRITVEQGYLNCRAVSRRRIDLRGTLLLGVRLYSTAERRAVCGAEGLGVQLRMSESSGVRVGDQTMRQFSLREELTQAPGRLGCAELVRSDCRPIVQECRIVAGRAVIKGELLLHLLYKTDLETGALEASDYTLPVSQLLELDGADEAAQCEAELFCAQLECTPDPDAMPGEGRLLIEAQMTAMLRFFHPVELVGATDSYSTLYVTETQAQKLRIPKLLAAVSERAVVRAQVDAPDGLESVIDVWVTPQKGTVRFSDGAMAAACQLQFTVLGRFADVGPDCFLHSSEAVVPLSISGADAQTDFSPRFSVLSASAGLTGASLQMTCELLVTGTALGFEVRSVITELTVDQSQPKPFDSAVGLMICYAKAGDRIWDISKRYGALPAQVMADNGLTDETIAENTVLLIPTAAQPV